MFFTKQSLVNRKEYINFLTLAGSLSNLFSDSSIPYLYYRAAEKIFCRSFKAENLSRSDVSVDAKKDSLGIGLKTFLSNNYRTFQKIAEFNNDRTIYESLKPESMMVKIAKLRNTRIAFTKNAHGLEKSIYHCVLREEGRFLIFEESLDEINIPKIRHVKKNENAVYFEDGKNEYSFLLSKSTLTKRFITKPIICNFEVKILKDPFSELKKLLQKTKLFYKEGKNIKQTIYLPLYGREKNVFPKSGLNQWNAGGRKRDLSEVYIPVPAGIHKNFPKFFPDRETPFNLKLPNGNIMQSKICQDGGKALMSYSNKELGQWILRDVLRLNEGELLTYEKLQTIGIDSVRIDKITDLEFEINFASLGSYEEFRNRFNL